MNNLTSNYWGGAMLLLSFFLVLAIGCSKENTEINEAILSETQVALEDFQTEFRILVPEEIVIQGDEKVKEFLADLSYADLVDLGKERNATIGENATAGVSNKVMACHYHYEYQAVVDKVFCRANGQIKKCTKFLQCYVNTWVEYDYTCGEWEDFGWCPDPSYFAPAYCGNIYDKQVGSGQMAEVAKFMQSEVDDKLKGMLNLYISNKSAIDEALTDENVLDAYLDFLETNADLYYKGFSGDKTTVEQANIDATETFLRQLADNLESEEVSTEIYSLINSLELTKGKEVKAALKALDTVK